MAIAGISTNVDSNGLSRAPAWVLTFLRFSNRSPERLSPSMGKAADTRKPLVVINDCISVSTSDAKGSPNGSCSIVLKMGDINYLTAVAPGDYFTVNLVHQEAKAIELYSRILGDRGAGPANINNFDDGFKGVFRVQSVHKTVTMDGKGAKTVLVNITGYSFVEMNNVIYFNPYLVSQGEKNNDVLFLTQLSSQWNKIIGLKNNNNSVQDLMVLLVQVFLGRGFNEAGRQLKGGLNRTENNLYLLPQGLGALMGHPTAKYAADLINIVCGIQKYTIGDSRDESEILNPKLTQNGRIFTTGNKVRGVSYAKPEYWNQIKVWDILQSYLNNVVNEMYTTFRPDPVTGNIMPTLVIRQKPFTSAKYAKTKTKVLATPFKSLPRWIPAKDEVLSYKVGRDEAARINFVQVFGRSQALMGGSNADIDQQIAMGNYSIDREDIKRSGLRPFITTSNFDYAGANVNDRLSQAPLWADLVGDWIIGGHLKMSGECQLLGVENPLAVGDNFQFDGIVYHIEGVQHTAALASDKRVFRTTLQLSSGVAAEANSQTSEFAEMINTDADLYREASLEPGETEHYEPGVTDLQDLPGTLNRANAEKTAPNPQLPFDVPSSVKSPPAAPEVSLAKRKTRK